eukprot:scaffold12803_cov19-Tisochrysis_lutea.AAC.4
MRELELIKYYNVAYKYKQLTFLPCKYEIQRKIRKWSPRLTSGAHFQSPLVAEERHAKGCTTCDLCWATSQKDKHAKQEAGHAVRHSQFSATTSEWDQNQDTSTMHQFNACTTLDLAQQLVGLFQQTLALPYLQEVHGQVVYRYVNIKCFLQYTQVACRVAAGAPAAHTPCA